jgi:hypothetical protein
LRTRLQRSSAGFAVQNAAVGVSRRAKEAPTASLSLIIRLTQVSGMLSPLVSICCW